MDLTLNTFLEVSGEVSNIIQAMLLKHLPISRQCATYGKARWLLFTNEMCEKHLSKSDILRKDSGHRPFPQVFLTHFGSKNQLFGFSIIIRLAANGL